MTLGLTDGKTNFGLSGQFSSLGTAGFTSLYGKNVGYSSLSGTPTLNVSAGLTTTASKSGLITSFSGITLGTIPSEKLGDFYIRY